MNDFIQRFILAAIVAAIFVGPARAGDGGVDTLGLDEVLVAVVKAPKLVQEIQHELDSNNLKADAVTCGTQRFGDDWKYLAGSPTPYYYCEIGKLADGSIADGSFKPGTVARTVWITCKCIFFDPDGEPLGYADKADRSRAKTFQDNWDWFWTD